MSRTRAAISRLSFTLRVFLYLALIGAVGYIGFGYTSGYVAVPGDTMLRLGAGQRDVVMFRKIDCETKTGGKAQGTENPSAAGGAAKGKTAWLGCDHPPMLALRNLELGPAGRIGVLTDKDGTSLNFRLDEKGKSHLTIRKGGQTSEHDFEGKTVPADVLAKVPEALREPLKRMVSGADEASPGVLVEREFNIQVPPPTSAPPLPETMPVPPPNDAGAYQIGMLRGDDGTLVEFRRNLAKDEAELIVHRAGETKTHRIAGKTVPEEILTTLPEDMRGPVKDMVAGEGRGAMHFNKGLFIENSEVGHPGVFVQKIGPGAGPGMPGGDVVFFNPSAEANLRPMVAGAPFERVIELPGPALVQQQVLGHTGLRAALVGVTIALVFLAILQLERLLAHFQRAELFSVRNRGLMRNLGALIVLIALVQAGGTLMPAILARTLHPALVGALGPHLLLVFAGFSLLLLSAVMAEAGRLEEEAEHTV